MALLSIRRVLERLRDCSAAAKFEAGYGWSLSAICDGLLSDGASDGLGSFAHCRIFESGRSAAILLTLLIEILQ